MGNTASILRNAYICNEYLKNYEFSIYSSQMFSLQNFGLDMHFWVYSTHERQMHKLGGGATSWSGLPDIRQSIRFLSQLWGWSWYS